MARPWQLLAGATLVAPVVLAEEYSEAAAKRHSYYAQAAFCNPAALAAWSCGEACRHAPVLPGSVQYLGPGPALGVRGFVAELPGASGTAEASPGLRRCIVAFRGTIGLKNTLADSEFAMSAWPPGRAQDGSRQCPGCHVHHGFAKAYRELRPQLLKALGRLRCHGGVEVTGHSLGAAVATLAAQDLRTANHSVDPVFLFGSPRVGDEAFAAAFQGVAAKRGVRVPAWRLVHFHDPVPRLAPRWVSFNKHKYTHIPREVYYTTEDSSTFRVCDGSGEDPTCADSTPLFRCLNTDHLRYLNISFAHTLLPAECTMPPGRVLAGSATPHILV